MIGTFGKIGCFSFQSYKLLNSGEGGVLVTDDPEILAKAVIMSGAYEHNWKKHIGLKRCFEKWQNKLPLYNLRLNNLSAVLLNAQLPELERRVQDGRRNHDPWLSIRILHGIAAGFWRRVLDIEKGVEDLEGEQLFSAACAVKQSACLREGHISSKEHREYSSALSNHLRDAGYDPSSPNNGSNDFSRAAHLGADLLRPQSHSPKRSTRYLGVT